MNDLKFTFVKSFITLTPGVNKMKLFFIVTEAETRLPRVFVSKSLFSVQFTICVWPRCQPTPLVLNNVIFFCRFHKLSCNWVFLENDDVMF